MKAAPGTQAWLLGQVLWGYEHSLPSHYNRQGMPYTDTVALLFARLVSGILFKQ